MFYPAQTSLIPTAVALARFLENEGFGAVFSNYPYWYLGSTPFRYLTGPILPSVLAFLHRFWPNLSLFEIMFGLIGVMWVVGGIGVYFLVRSLANSSTSEESLPPAPRLRRAGRATIRGVPWLAAVFYLLGPIVPFLFPFSDGTYLLAFSILPFILFFYLQFLQKPELKLKPSLVALITLAILLDTLIIPSLFLGMMAIFLAQVGWKKAEEKLKKSLWLMAYSLLLATFWYTPGYWWTLLTAPSFGGKGLGQVIVWVGKLLPVALALTLAVFSARFFKKRHLGRDFCLFWLFIFGFLTLIRFFSDPDFWLDWTAYGLELQLGLGIALGLIIKPLFLKPSAIRHLPYAIFTTLYFFTFAFVFNKYVLGTLQRDITQTVEYRVGKWLSENTKPGEKVFLSGTTAFWLNAFFDIPQVRGGRDQTSLDPNWREATWEIRDGSTGSPQAGSKSVEWLKKLGVSYLVIHSSTSSEYYHDFKDPEKFEDVGGLRRVFEEQGDYIYRVEEE